MANGDYAQGTSRPGDRYDQTAGRQRGSHRYSGMQFPVCTYLDRQGSYFHVRQFAAIPETHRDPKRSHHVAWYQKWLHFPVDRKTVLECYDELTTDIPYLRSLREEHYQRWSNMLLRELYDNFVDPMVQFPPSGHNLLGVMSFPPPYDQLYWVKGHLYWNELPEPEGSMRMNFGYLCCWQQVDFHDMEPTDQNGVYLRLPFFQDVKFQDFWKFSNLSTVPTPSLAAYHSRQMLNEPTDCRNWLNWQVFTMQWAVFVLMDF